ncbi:MAG TPA: SDR family oxidoreductase [Thermoanaerobaculia bacterium]|nr:SDR family oxidoreductase [Thermoanaerobaculia bacterium]
MRRARQVVVVTGASAGVGRAAVRAFAARGADVGLIARGEDGLEAARGEVEAAGGRALVLPLDVADAEAVEAAADRVESELGPIDVWVNNAMVTVMGRVRDMSAADFRRVTEVDYLGAVHGTLAALRHMLPRDRGTIVQVGSALAYRAIPLQSAYCGAKFALRGFTDSLRTELLAEGSQVRLTMVQLPALNTPQFGWSKVVGFDRQPQPVPPIFQPEVAAEAIVFAARSGRREVWVGGMAATIIAGNKVAPTVGDRYLARTGYDSQFTDQPLAPDRRHNLDEPVPGDHGAHGPFDDRAETRSPAFELSKHRAWLAAAAAGLGLLGLFAARRSDNG